MNFSNQHERLPLSDRHLLLQEQMQQQQLLLQRLQQNRREQQIAELSNLHIPDIHMNTALSNARLANQGSLPLMLQRKNLQSNASHLVDIPEAQNEFQRIIALQDEVQRQLLRRKIEEEIRIANDLSRQQALAALELERQKQQVQRNTNAQLLSQFVNMDQLAARQELLSGSLGGHPSLNGRFTSNAINGRNEILGLNGLGPHPTSASLNSLNQSRNKFDLLTQVLNQRNDQISRPGVMDLQSQGFKSLEAVSNIASLESDPTGISRGRIIEETNTKSSPVNKTPVQMNIQQPELPTDKAKSNQDENSAIRSVDPSKLPKIRFFNNGNEVNEDGKVIEIKEGKSKKRKLLSKMSKEQGYTTSSSKYQRKLPLRKGIISKLAKQKSLKEQQDSSDELDNEKPKIEGKDSPKQDKGKKKRKVIGPHHDLMLEFFPSNAKENTEKKEDDKMNAANALLGFSKSS